MKQYLPKSLGNITALQYVGLVLFVTISYSSLSYAKKPSYRGIGDVECIKEKECAWYAFQKHIQNSSPISNSQKIKKWDVDIAFFMSGDGAKTYFPLVEYASKELDAFFPYNLTVNFSSTLQIIFTDDLDKAFNNLDRILSGKFLSKNNLNDWYEQAKPLADGCVGLNLNEEGKNNIRTAFLIVDQNHKDAKHCFISGFYGALGMHGFIDYQKFYDDYDEVGREHTSYTYLHKYLLYLLYRSEIKNGMSFDVARKVFDDIYDDTITKFFKIIEE